MEGGTRGGGSETEINLLIQKETVTVLPSSLPTSLLSPHTYVVTSKCSMCQYTFPPFQKKRKINFRVQKNTKLYVPILFIRLCSISVLPLFSISLILPIAFSLSARSERDDPLTHP